MQVDRAAAIGPAQGPGKSKDQRTEHSIDAPVTEINSPKPVLTRSGFTRLAIAPPHAQVSSDYLGANGQRTIDALSPDQEGHSP